MSEPGNTEYVVELTSDGPTVQLIVDVDVTVEEAMSLAEVIEEVCDRASSMIPPGSYTVRVMATVVGEEDCAS